MAKKKKSQKAKMNRPKKNPQKAAAFANEGLEFCRSGDYSRGIALLHKAEERIDGSDQIFLNLALAYQAQGNFVKARKYFAKTMRLKPEHVFKILQSGINELAMNKLASAECCIGAVYDLDPANITAKLATGSLLLRRGDKSTGQALIRECYVSEPKMTSAIVELAEFSLITEDDIKLVQDNMARGIGDKANDKYLLLALAKGYDNLAQYDKAFDFCSRANELFAQSAPITNTQAANDLEGHLDSLTNFMTTEYLEKYKGVSKAGENLVFIVGLPKSGLHEAAFLLQDSEKAVIAGEMNWCNEKIFQLLQANDNDFQKIMTLITPQMVETLVGDYENKIKRLRSNSKLIVNCKVSNFVNIWFIKILFPKAKVICATRNIDDQVLDIFFNNTANMEYLNDIMAIGSYCLHFNKIIELWKKLFSDEIITFDYDEYICNPESSYKKLIGSLGVTKPKMIEFVKVDSPSHIATEIYSPELTISQRYKEYTAKLEGVLRPESQELGLNFGNFNTANEGAPDTNGVSLNFGKGISEEPEKPNDGFKLKF